MQPSEHLHQCLVQAKWPTRENIYTATHTNQHCHRLWILSGELGGSLRKLGLPLGHFVCCEQRVNVGLGRSDAHFVGDVKVLID